jgi:hypothetical protein
MFDHALGRYPHANAVATPASVPRLGYLFIWLYDGLAYSTRTPNVSVMYSRVSWKDVRGGCIVPSARDPFGVGACVHVSVRTILSFREFVTSGTSWIWSRAGKATKRPARHAGMQGNPHKVIGIDR